MNKGGDCKSWLSAHIYFKGNIYGPECDRVILDIITPFITQCKEQKLFEKYFFIRYSEFGSHVRLRFYGKQNHLDSIKTNLGKKITGYNNQDILTLPQSPDQQISNSPLAWLPYEPEIERYGGIDAIKIAEEFFYYSSETAIKLIKKIPGGEYSSRLGKGLLSMVVLLFVFANDREKAIDFIQSYGNDYLKAFAGNEEIKTHFTEAFDSDFNNQSHALIEYTNALWLSLKNENNLSEVLGKYQKYIEIISTKLKILTSERRVYNNNNVVEDWQNCIKLMVPSYIHMMNNRLGLSIKDESYLAYLTAKSLKIESEIEYETGND